MHDPQPHPILVTGAGRRIGAHISRRLLQDGYSVFVHYRTETDEVAQLNELGAETLAADFTDAAGILAFAKAVQQRCPGLRGIIHNASSFGPTAEDPGEAAAQLQRFYTAHMLTPFLLNRALADRLAGDAGQPADIIHITDIYADNPPADYDAYCATKAGLQNLALSAAKRLAPGVKVNVIQPGPIEFADWHSPAERAQILEGTLLNRTGGAESIYRTVRSILDNDFMTGAVIPIDGGKRLGR